MVVKVEWKVAGRKWVFIEVTSLESAIEVDLFTQTKIGEFGSFLGVFFRWVFQPPSNPDVPFGNLKITKTGNEQEQKSCSTARLEHLDEGFSAVLYLV